MSRMDELFGELRSLLQSDENVQGYRMRAFLEEAYALDEARYQEEWLPYLERAQELPWFFAQTFESVEQIAALVPESAHIALVIESSGFDYAGFKSAACLERVCKVDVNYTCKLYDAKFALMMESPYLSGVKVLELGGNHLGDDAMRALASSASMHGLERICLYHNEVTSEGAKALAASMHLGQLEELDISVNDIQDDGLIAIGSSENLGALRVLNVRSNKIKRRGVETFARDLKLTRLKSLKMDQNNVGNYGAQALANCELLSGLKELTLARARVNDKGAAYVRESPYLELDYFLH